MDKSVSLKGQFEMDYVTNCTTQLIQFKIKNFCNWNSV